MFRLLAPAALLLLSIVPTVTEVVRSISECNEYFLDDAAPDIPGILVGGKILHQNRYKAICQTWDHTRRFVTLYDTENKIPVFSAYKYQGAEKIKRFYVPWKIEPQLEDESRSKNMMNSTNETYSHQAGEEDYLNRLQKLLTRGHLFPFSYGSTRDDKVSTCTLTNIVPQEKTFNQGSWNKMETCVKCVLDEYCKNSIGKIEGYLVTGAQPGNITMNNRVNVPHMMWSAFCCQSHGKWLASAYWGRNEEEKVNEKRLETKTLRELELKIGEARMFPGTQCPLNTKVSDLYPKLDVTCNCPPHISTTSASSTTSRPNYTLTAMSITTAYLLLVLTWSF